MTAAGRTSRGRLASGVLAAESAAATLQDEGASGRPGIRAEATCAFWRGGGRAWQVRRDLEGAAEGLEAASVGDGAGVTADRSAAQEGGPRERIGNASVRSSGGGWGELVEGADRQARWRGKRRRRRGRTAANWGGCPLSPSSLPQKS